MTTKEAVALLERYSNYDGMGIPNLAGCKEAMRVAVDALKEACPELNNNEEQEYIRKDIVDETIKTAEDHAYFAGQEKFREKLIEWAKENIDSLGRLSYGELIEQFGGKTEIDVNTYPRCLFQEGYEQAEKDFCWHSVDESLPPMDEEVIVLLDEWNEVRIEPLYRIAFGHIVNKEYCEDFSGWNIPGVGYWMPMPEIPKEEKK